MQMVIIIMSDYFFYLDFVAESGVFFPDNPEDDLITFKSDADTRFGYWKHVIIHMTWQRPRGE